MSCVTKIATDCTLPVVFLSATENCVQSGKIRRIFFGSLESDNTCTKTNENSSFNSYHRSWNITQQTGYRITAVTLANGEATEYQPFIEGWLQKINLYGAVPFICYNRQMDQYLSPIITAALFITLVKNKIK